MKARRICAGAIAASLLAGSTVDRADGAVADVADDVLLGVLRGERPEVTWRRHVIRGDFTGDGKRDVAVLGSTDTAVVVAVVVGPLGDGSELVSHSLPIGPEGVSPECVRAASLKAEPIVLPPDIDDGRKRPPTQKGLRIGKPPCTVVHFYWDPSSRWFVTWRRPE
jgi:hypothetical protein